MNKKKVVLKAIDGVYHINGKEYGLADELVKGGCQGCAFYARLDCHCTGKTDICTTQHKIFKRLINHQ